MFSRLMSAVSRFFVLLRTFDSNQGTSLRLELGVAVLRKYLNEALDNRASDPGILAYPHFDWVKSETGFGRIDVGRHEVEGAPLAPVPHSSVRFAPTGTTAQAGASSTRLCG